MIFRALINGSKSEADKGEGAPQSESEKIEKEATLE